MSKKQVQVVLTIICTIVYMFFFIDLVADYRLAKDAVLSGENTIGTVSKEKAKTISYKVNEKLYTIDNLDQKTNSGGSEVTVFYKIDEPESGATQADIIIYKKTMIIAVVFYLFFIYGAFKFIKLAD